MSDQPNSSARDKLHPSDALPPPSNLERASVDTLLPPDPSAGDDSGASASQSVRQPASETLLPLPEPVADSESPTLLPVASSSVPDTFLPPAAAPKSAADTLPPPAAPSDTLLETMEHAPTPPDVLAKQLRAGHPTAGLSDVRPLDVPGYEVLGELGRGGMGVVYKARQVRLNRTVALKMILGSAHVSDEALARFQREAEAVARVQHPNIVQIYEVGDHNGLPYFSLIHRDLKPANILLQRVEGGGLLSPGAPGLRVESQRARATPDGATPALAQAELSTLLEHRTSDPQPSTLNLQLFSPKITDFGLAKQLEGDATATRSGAVMGTPSYMAPEQAAGRTKEIGPLADVYALGAILYNLLTGRPPFRAESVMDTLRLVIEADPIAPRLLNPTLDRDLETICLKCLEKDPQRRYPSALSLASDLLRYRAGMPIEARPISARARAWRHCKRRPLVSSLAALFVVSLLTTCSSRTASSQRAAPERAGDRGARGLSEESGDQSEVGGGGSERRPGAARPVPIALHARQHAAPVQAGDRGARGLSEESGDRSEVGGG